jgi:hypothetical protein
MRCQSSRQKPADDLSDEKMHVFVVVVAGRQSWSRGEAICSVHAALMPGCIHSGPHPHM